MCLSTQRRLVPLTTLFFLLFSYYSLHSQLTLFGDLYIAPQNEMHIAAGDLYFKSGKSSPTEGPIQEPFLLPREPLVSAPTTTPTSMDSFVLMIERGLLFPWVMTMFSTGFAFGF